MHLVLPFGQTKPNNWKQQLNEIRIKIILPNFHFTNGIGEPTATQVNVRFAPNITSFNGSGGTENCGGTRRTFTYNDVGFECSVPTEFSATHSYLP